MVNTNIKTRDIAETTVTITSHCIHTRYINYSDNKIHTYTHAHTHARDTHTHKHTDQTYICIQVKREKSLTTHRIHKRDVDYGRFARILLDAQRDVATDGVLVEIAGELNKFCNAQQLHNSGNVSKM